MEQANESTIKHSEMENKAKEEEEQEEEQQEEEEDEEEQSDSDNDSDSDNEEVECWQCEGKPEEPCYVGHTPFCITCYDHLEEKDREEFEQGRQGVEQEARERMEMLERQFVVNEKTREQKKEEAQRRRKRKEREQTLRELFKKRKIN